MVDYNQESETEPKKNSIVLYLLLFWYVSFVIVSSVCTSGTTYSMLRISIYNENSGAHQKFEFL